MDTLLLDPFAGATIITKFKVLAPRCWFLVALMLITLLESNINSNVADQGGYLSGGHQSQPDFSNLSSSWLWRALFPRYFPIPEMMPRDPSSIATKLGLFSRGNLVDKLPGGLENRTTEELGKMSSWNIWHSLETPHWIYMVNEDALPRGIRHHPEGQQHVGRRAWASCFGFLSIFHKERIHD